MTCYEFCSVYFVFPGGWLLRKAWKIYEKLYKEMSSIRENGGKLKTSASSNSLKQVASQNSIKTSSSQGSLSSSSLGTSSDATDGNDNEIPIEVLDRLQGAVNFGYGTFQICISMIPPKIIKIIEFLGFEGDREIGNVFFCSFCAHHLIHTIEI